MLLTIADHIYWLYKYVVSIGTRHELLYKHECVYGCIYVAAEWDLEHDCSCFTGSSADQLYAKNLHEEEKHIVRTLRLQQDTIWLHVQTDSTLSVTRVVYCVMHHSIRGVVYLCMHRCTKYCFSRNSHFACLQDICYCWGCRLNIQH